MGMKRLGNRGRAPRVGKLMVKQGGFGSAEPVMVPSPREPLRIEAVGQPLPQRDGHLRAATARDKTRRTEGQDKKAPAMGAFLRLATRAGSLDRDSAFSARIPYDFSMRLFRILASVLALSSLSATPVSAQLIDDGSSGLRLIQDVPAAETPVEPAPARAPAPHVEWVDVAKVIDGFGIPEKLADLRGVAVDGTGENFGLYFASVTRETFTVYRNGRRMLTNKIESIYELKEPVVFRMTGSGDLLYAVHGTDLYVNGAPVSIGGFSFNTGAESVVENGGILTYPDGGSIMEYDIRHGTKKTLYRHAGAIQYMHRQGSTIAYALLSGGVTRMYRDGRRVSARAVENPYNFTLSPEGDVYFFTKAPRGYALFRNTRSYMTGVGQGAYVAVGPDGQPWHISYVKNDDGTNVVRLQRGRRRTDVLPAGIGNLELLLAFPGRGYAVRAAYDDSIDDFYLVRDGDALGSSFLFEHPYNDTHGFTVIGNSVSFRAYDGTRWRAYLDGVPLLHESLDTVLTLRADGDTLVVYAAK